MTTLDVWLIFWTLIGIGLTFKYRRQIEEYEIKRQSKGKNEK